MPCRASWNVCLVLLWILRPSCVATKPSSPPFLPWVRSGLSLITPREGPNRPTRKRTLLETKNFQHATEYHVPVSKRITRISCRSNADRRSLWCAGHTHFGRRLLTGPPLSIKAGQTRKERPPSKTEGSHVQTSEKCTEDNGRPSRTSLLLLKAHQGSG